MALITDLTQYEADREDIKEYYANLLILQYRNKRKARETIKLWVDLFLCDGLILQLPDILDLDKASGECLDIIGKILGCPREVQGLVVDKNYFHFYKPPEGGTVFSQLGFSTVDIPRKGSFKTIANSNLSLYELDNDNYRVLLKIKAVANVLRGTMADIDNALKFVFGNKAMMRNNKNLTIDYIIATNNPIAIQAASLKGYFKAPMGVTATVHIVPIDTDVNTYVIP